MFLLYLYGSFEEHPTRGPGAGYCGWAEGYRALRSEMERDEKAILGGIDRCVEKGDFEGALGGAARLVAGHHITKEKGEEMNLELERRVRYAVQLQRMEADPRGFMQALEEGLIEATPAEKVRLRRGARSLQRRRENEAMEALDHGILRGEIRTGEEIRQRAAVAGLSEDDVASLVAALTVEEPTSSEGRAFYLRSYDGLWKRALSYDPVADPEGAEGRKLLREIRAKAGAGERQSLLDNLRSGMREGRSVARLRALGLEEVIDRLAGLGLLVARPSDAADPAEQARYEVRVAQRTVHLKREVRAWVRENPKADPAEDRKWMASLIGADVRLNSAARFSTPKR